MATVTDEFRGKGVVRRGELMLRATDAIAFVRRCRERDIEILGVDGFHLKGKTIQPDMGESIDLSRPADQGSGVPSWDRAEEFLARRIASELFFKVVVDEA